MKYIWIFILAITTASCSNPIKDTIEQTKRNITSEKAISYKIDQLTIQGSTSNDTLFIKQETEAIFKYCLADTLFGYQFISRNNYIHPHYNIPVQFTYSYDTLKLMVVMKTEVENKETKIYKADLKPAAYGHTIRGQIPMINKILSYDGFKLLSKKDTILNDCKCVLLRVVDENEIPYDLFIDKRICFPKLLRITVNAEQPYIQEFNYMDFEYLNAVDESTFIAEKVINSKAVKPLGIGEVLPSWKLNNLDGQDFDFETTLGKTTILYISMINCSACQASLPMVKKLQKKYQNQNIQFLAFYPIDSKEKLDKYIIAKEINYPIVYNSKKETKQRFAIINKLRFAYPKVLILNHKNEIVWINSGSSPNLEELIEAELKV